MVQAFFSETAGFDVAIVVEDRKGVSLFEHAGAFISQACGGQDVARPALATGSPRCPFASLAVFFHVNWAAFAHDDYSRVTCFSTSTFSAASNRNQGSLV